MSITKHPEGSLRELCAIAFPLMLTSFSVLLMIFCDRWMLAHYSAEAHNAAVGATTLAWAFIFGWIVLGGIAEVFVAQYNGAKLYQRLGEPVWQMIWLSLGSWAFFLPVSYFGTEWFFGQGAEAFLERQYFSIMVLFGPFYALYAALCGFFIGQGKTRLVTCVVVSANVVNVLLDWGLIFGVEGWFSGIGVPGAAISTSLATVFQCVVLGIVFLNAHNRREFGTSCWQVKPTALWDCVRVGLPSAVFVMMEILAYAIYYAMMKDLGVAYITVTGICQSMLILFFFFAEGINKATATIVGNMIGGGRSFLVSKVMRAGVVLNLLFLAVLLAAFIYGMPMIIDQFLPYAETDFIDNIRGPLEISLILMAIYIFFEGLRLQFSGLLTAAGDTMFLFLAGASSVWAMMLLPVYIFVIRGGATVEVAPLICMIYSAAISAIYYWRIAGGKWRTLSISSDLEAARG